MLTEIPEDPAGALAGLGRGEGAGAAARAARGAVVVRRALAAPRVQEPHRARLRALL